MAPAGRTVAATPAHRIGSLDLPQDLLDISSTVDDGDDGQRITSTWSLASGESR